MRCRSDLQHDRIFAALGVCLVFCPLLHAEEDWIRKSREILEGAKQKPMPQWLSEAMHPTADVAGIRKPAAKNLGFSSPASDKPGSPGTYIFVSQSLGLETLREIIWENRGHKDRLIVFRGFGEGQSLKEFIGGFRPLIQGIDRRELPPITIDPERFTKYGITSVPAIVRTDLHREAQVVRGIHDVEWLNRQVASQPSQNDYGIRGETIDISEPDLLLQVKERFRTFDWAGYQKKAQGDFWQETHFESLPEALKDREYWIDPTFTVSRDLRNTKGQLIAVTGQKINPLTNFPFHQKIIVFDATRVSQIQAIESELKKEPTRRVTLIATGIDRTLGWKGYESLQQRLGSRVFLLTPDIRKRFKLSVTPSMVEAKDQRFLIREIGMGVAG